MSDTVTMLRNGKEYKTGGVIANSDKEAFEKARYTHARHCYNLIFNDNERVKTSIDKIANEFSFISYT